MSIKLEALKRNHCANNILNLSNWQIFIHNSKLPLSPIRLIPANKTYLVLQVALPEEDSLANMTANNGQNIFSAVEAAANAAAAAATHSANEDNINNGMVGRHHKIRINRLNL